MGKDGMEGVREMKAQGATIIAQDKDSSVAWGMPRSVIEAELADLVLAQFLQQGGLLLQFAVQVKSQVLFAGREADVEPVSLARLATVVAEGRAKCERCQDRSRRRPLRGGRQPC